jgi:hypothetical protein
VSDVENLVVGLFMDGFDRSARAAKSSVRQPSSQK